ncbi:MAG: hypothetical protein K9H16_15330, partial [Bacteroidales bacterium]|nr:hypothetical protein [Bacteroidales bacterium]
MKKLLQMIFVVLSSGLFLMAIPSSNILQAAEHPEIAKICFSFSNAESDLPKIRQGAFETNPSEMEHFAFEGGDPSILWSIFLNEVKIDGADAGEGDELAIFDGEKMVGQWTLTEPVVPGTYMQSLLAYKTLLSGQGYLPGHAFTIKFWDSSVGLELDSPEYLFIDPYGQGLYMDDVFPAVDNSFSLINLTFTTPIIPQVPVLLSAEAGDGTVTLTWEAAQNNSETGHFNFEGGDPSVLWSVFLNSVSINGNNAEAGDELAIYDGSKMVGQWTLSDEVIPGTFYQSLLAYKTLLSGPGYQAGNAFSIRFWDESEGVETDMFEYQFIDPWGQGLYLGDVFPAEDNAFSIADLQFQTNSYVPLFNLYFNDGTLIADNIENNSYTVEGLTNGTEYCFYVTQILEAGSESVPSNALCETPFVPCLDAIANAGSDATITSFGQFQIVEASAENFVSLKWETGGDGTFSDILSVDPTYFPGQNDIIIGTVELCITAYANPGCDDDFDCMILTIEQGVYFEPVWTTPFNPMSFYIITAAYDAYNLAAGDEVGIFDIDPYSGLEICVGSATVGDEFGTEDYLEIICSMDDGSNQESANGFTPGNAFIFKYFIPGTGLVEDVSYIFPYNGYDEVFAPLGNAIVELFASSVACENATANAGDDVLICVGMQYQLQGEAGNYLTLEWITNGDGYFDDPTQLDASYTPGTNDIAMGTINLCLTAQAFEPCQDAEDCMTLTIQALPVICAGMDASVCNGEIFQLEATAENYLALQWTSTGDGFFSDENLLAGTYTPGPGDILSGNVELCLNASGISPCGYVSDCMILSVVEGPELIS